MDQLMKLGPFAAIGRLWNDLSSAQRAMVAAFVGLAVVVGTLAALIASKPRMAVLFSGLASEDAGAIAQKLNEEKVPYQLSGDGGTIEVPADKVYDLRLKMATQGLPQGGNVGFELFDKTNFGMTEFTQKMNYQRAIQGELTRTICQLRPVMSARVHVSIPQETVFASEQEPAKASVALKLRRGMPLTDEQVAGVVHLVSSAVEGLKPENVDVVDQDGNVLSSGTGGTTGALSANQLKLKRQYENEITANLQSMLTRIVGPDKAVVRVSAEMDFDQKQTKAETYEPAGGTAASGQTAAAGQTGVLSSQETLTETYTGSAAPSILGGGAARTTSSGGDRYNRATTTAQYQVSRKIEERVSAPGQVTRLSVAVLVDKSVPSSQIPSIRDAVTAAAGVKPGRDTVTVQAVAFDKTTQRQIDKEMAAAARNELIATVAKNAGAVVLLLGFLAVLRSIVSGIKVQAPSTPMAGGAVREAETTVSTAQSGSSAAQHQAEQQIRQSGESQSSELPPEIVQSSPEELARLVRSWMSEQ